MDPIDPRWWEEYFDARFAEVYRPLLSSAQTRREVSAVLRLLGLPQGSRVLDVGCGWGRHAVPLSLAGHTVVGADLSEFLLAEAALGAVEAAAPDVTWVRADMRALPFAGAFDGAVSLFSSMGYFLSDAEDLRALRAIREALRPGGTFVLETMHRDRLAREYALRDWWETGDGATVRVERTWDPVRGISRERLLLDGPGGRWEKHHEIRVRSATEWRGLLREAGLEPLVWCGDWRLRRFSATSPRLTVLARRPREPGPDA
jgi:SAM-dependent methyltransferase